MTVSMTMAWYTINNTFPFTYLDPHHLSIPAQNEKAYDPTDESFVVKGQVYEVSEYDEKKYAMGQMIAFFWEIEKGKKGKKTIRAEYFPGLINNPGPPDGCSQVWFEYDDKSFVVRLAKAGYKRGWVFIDRAPSGSQ